MTSKYLTVSAHAQSLERMRKNNHTYKGAMCFVCLLCAVFVYLDPMMGSEDYEDIAGNVLL